MHLELRNVEVSALEKRLEMMKHEGESLRVPRRENLNTGSRILLLGIDGASWKIIDPLILQGELPTFKKLIREGVSGKLQNLCLSSCSPAIWTDIATSKHSIIHGIESFLQKIPGGKEDVPVNRSMRKAKAVWNIISEHDKKVCVVGWWVTWPAEEVNGFLVSDYAWPAKRSNHDGMIEGSDPSIKLPHKTYPEELINKIDSFIVTEDDISPDEHFGLGLPPFDKSLQNFKYFPYAKDRSYKDIAKHLLQNNSLEFCTLYLQGIDAMCHWFWPHLPSEGFMLDEKIINDNPLSEGYNPFIFDFHKVIPNYYSLIDKWLAELLECLDHDFTVIIVSDHGFKTNPEIKALEGIRVSLNERGPLYPYGHDNEDGIVFMWGKNIREGIKIDGAKTFDISPTILALMGLPVANDMLGRVLVEAFEEEFLLSNPVTYVNTFEDKEQIEIRPVDSAVDEEVRKRLKSLGYVE